jgi:ribose transport system ATP-binding protein
LASDTALELKGLAKTFGPRQVLAVDHFALNRGEIHGLVGANGSGKSTLVKILAGYYDPDPGSEVAIFGKRMSLPIHDPRGHGLGIVHQDLGLVPELSVLENISVGVNYGTAGIGRISWRREMRSARRFLDHLGITIDPKATVGSLDRGAQTVVALARCLRQLEATERGSLLLLDEPTVAFDRDEVEVLFGVMRRIASGGNAVVLISHRLPEVLEICDRITVLRDGKVVTTAETQETSLEAVVSWILGQSLETFFPARPPVSRIGPVVLRVTDLAGARVRSISFDLSQGEILGVTGLEGMGQDDLPYLLLGLRSGGRRRVELAGEDVTGLDPAAALKKGLITVPSDRAKEGLWTEGRLFENLTLGRLGDYFRGGVLRKQAEQADATRSINTFRVKAPGPRAPVSSLSGGNQQKVVLARALRSAPRVLVLHNPTVGVDARSRHDIIELVFQAASNGSAILYISREYEELANICDRVLVLNGGQMEGVLSGSALTEDAILKLCHTR